MLPITTLVAALAGIALVGFGLFVSVRRRSAGLSVGTGDDPVLLRRVRVHGNFAEYVPTALILLALNEYRGAPAAGLWTMAVLLVAGRALHAAGLLTGRIPAVATGMVATHGTLLIGAGMLLLG